MREAYLSSLCRGIGIKGEAYQDHKLRFPSQVPFSLEDIKFTKSEKSENLRNKRPLPGTYLTEKGQILLYTQQHKNPGIPKETSIICKNMAEVYNVVESISDKLKKRNIKCEKSRNNFGNIYSAYNSLYNNWCYPQKWKSSAKELIPNEVYEANETLKNFLKKKKIYKMKHSNSSNVESKNLKIKSDNRQKDNFLPKIIDKCHLLRIQEQNNALNESQILSEFRSQSLSNSDISLSGISDNIEIFKNTDNNTFEFHENITSPIVKPNDFYEAEEIIIPINTRKKSQKFKSLEESLLGPEWRLTLPEALGEDFIAIDRNINFKTLKYLKPDRLTTRMRGTETQRMILINTLNTNLKILTNIIQSLKWFGEKLLQQFQDYNLKNRKKRIEIQQENMYQTVKVMKTRNEEINKRLNKVTENILIQKKPVLDRISFRKEWEIMKNNLQNKTNWDTNALNDKLSKVIMKEEEELKKSEFEILKFEKEAIKHSLAKFREEIVKIDERRQETENFIIRLEMRRENLSKMEREIDSSTPLSINLNNINLVDYIKNIKNEIILEWKNKMKNMANDFKMDERVFYELTNSINLLERSKSSLSDSIDDKICEDTNKQNKSEQLFKKEEVSEIKDIVKTSSSDTTNIEQVLNKIDFEHLQISQRISSNHSFSYFIPWPKENYESFNQVSDESEDETLAEGDTKQKMKTKDSCQLNYKRILHNKPPKSKKTRTNAKEKNKNKCKIRTKK